jgi:diguanylate cyclase (GGDEF)-like protein
MENYVYFFLSIEMLLINVFVMHIVSQRKFATRSTYWLLGLFSLGMALVMGYLLDLREPFTHSGVELLLGFFLLGPYKYLYRQSFIYTFATTCTSWLYTFLLFSLSIRTAALFSSNWYGWVCLGTLTFLYLTTIIPFIRSMKKASQALSRITDETLLILSVLGSLWFISCILLNILFVRYGTSYLELLVTLSLMLCTLLSYRVFYSLIVMSTTAKKLRIKTETDPLTGLKNRQALISDARRMLDKHKAFSLVFIDLDRFKQVNDRYGHVVGDNYLIHFASVIRKNYGGTGTLYRLSGDEFVFLYLGQDLETFCRELESKVRSTYKGMIAFLGLSMGCATYPKDGLELSQLLKIADLKMYQQKKMKQLVRS